MGFTQNQLDKAEGTQFSAAHDESSQVRLVAGPGTGKSSAIEERVSWLLKKGVPPETIYAVSFTRAAALDLKNRILRYCQKKGQVADSVSATTLHSLALRTLRKAGLLSAFYPADPLVLDSWELENIFDAEFAASTGLSKARREEIRKQYEAFWSTGKWDPPNYAKPEVPISDSERGQFSTFLNSVGQIYACVLPGDVIRQCVERVKAGSLDPVTLLGIKHLIVDEYQDLNPLDLEFIDLLHDSGAKLFVAGDDDQSIYSFRYAFPSGIQNFLSKYPTAGRHILSDCFRCTPTVLTTAQSLISAHQDPRRIPKQHVSLYAESNPPIKGSVLRWRFPNDKSEAKAIAKSCQDLIVSGVEPREILILLSNARALCSRLGDELNALGIPWEPPRTQGFVDTAEGRVVLSILRIACSPKDYVAHRTLLGIQHGIGITTCRRIAETVVTQNTNFLSLFYETLPERSFGGKAKTALDSVRSVCDLIKGWIAEDPLELRSETISAIIANLLGVSTAEAWDRYRATLPKGIVLREVRDLLWADTDEQQAFLLKNIYERLGQTPPDGRFLPERVRVMTMHGSKGLSGKVVFIPGLEEDLLPGERRQAYPGLIQEAARLLYVAITRARVSCILSFAKSRTINGRLRWQTPSRFVQNLAGPFVDRDASQNNPEIVEIVKESSLI